MKVISHFRKSFPSAVTAATLKKLGYAPKNESYVLNVLRFLALIDDEGKCTAAARDAFSQHEDPAFQKKFDAIAKKAYSSLFDLHGDGAWSLDQSALITFFRQSDQTTAIVGQRQANTFQLLAAFAGHADIPEIRGRKAADKKGSASAKTTKKTRRKAAAATSKNNDQGASGSASDSTSSNVGLTVRIEINLPADGDQKTYDRIFKSLRENLLND
ncbi:MAG: DUF5343 domain-containing protein [Planctomycetes bacterium]|nr:DUF5343 domain-containing protein [Planctomycetota bacterium]